MTKPTEADFQEIIGYLNLKCHKNFRVSEKARGFMRARFKDGYEVKDFKKVIDNQLAQWGNDPKMSPYLRYHTLFNGKFDAYLNNNPPKVGLAPGEMKEKPVERKPDPLQNNKEFNDAIKVSMECMGKEDPESKQRYKRALATMDRLSEQVKNDEIIDGMESQLGQQEE